MEAVSEMTLGEALHRTEQRLKSAGVPDPGKEALFMVAELMVLKPAEVYLKRETPVDPDRLRTLNEWVTRRLGREPLQYITGSCEFRGLGIKVSPDVLIPRPETELLVSEGITTVDSASPLILDLCTGSGCIAVAMAKEVPEARVFATDIGDGALRLAGENAAMHNVAGRIEFLEGDLFGALRGLGLEGSFDLIISNPPYVSGDEMNGLQPEIRLFEPYAALYGGEDGFHFIRRIVEGAPEFLRPGGALILEIGYGQSAGVGRMLKESENFEAVEIKKDLSGIDRILKARKSVFGQ
jgi:release factor glutamine methyltransferase